MCLKIPLQLSVAITLMLTMSDSLWAQSGCARCSAPAVAPYSNGPLVPQPVATNRIRYDRPRVEDTPPLTDPITSTGSGGANPGERRFLSPVSRSAPLLIPTDPDLPDALPVEPNRSEKLPPATKPTENRLSTTDKISLRYSDPRVLRMLSQLTPEGAESLYLEVSDLIDGRHLAPATNAQRVDRALDHLKLALDVPAFVQAAHVQATSEELTGFKDFLQRLKNKVRVRNNNDALGTLRSVQLMAAQTIDIDPSAIGLEFVYGATDSLDQFSMLMPPEKSGGPSVGLRDQMVGIGVEVEQHPEGLKILKLIPGGPAAQADLRRGDVITHANGTELKRMELNRSVDRITGPEGTPLEIQAARGDRTGRVTLVRKRMTVPSIVDVRMEDPSQGVAYLKLEQFAESTASELDTALMQLHRQGMRALIMDLRGNPGGLLNMAIAVSDRFLPSGTIVSTRGRTESDNTVETAHYGQTWKMPLVVLIDHNSASASEIFAAAIQENHRGLIVGEKSYGKGTVQTLFPLQSVPAGLRLTTAKFYSPQGHEMAGVGVSPDVPVSSGGESADQQDAALSEGLRQIRDPRIKEMANRLRRTGEVVEDTHVAT